jgi:hypothetical protein
MSTALTGRPQACLKPLWHKLGVGGGYEIPNIPENKTRCGFGFEWIKIRENTLKLPLDTLASSADDVRHPRLWARRYGHCGLAAEPGPREV